MANPTNFSQHWQTAGTQAFVEGGISMQGYQTKDTGLLSNFVYLNGSSTLARVAVATGTETQNSTNGPVVATQFNGAYDPATPTVKPQVAQSYDYTTITAAANNDGSTYKVTMDLSRDGLTGVASAVIRSGAGTAISGKIKLRSSVGNESVYAFTTPATTAWTTFTWNPQVAGSGVTLTGTPVFSGITLLEITLDALSTSVDVAMVSTANHNKLVIGEKFEFKVLNPDSADFKYGFETAVREAYQQQVGKTATGKKPTFEFSTTLQNLILRALVTGTMTKRGQKYITTRINNVGQKTIAAGAVTFSTGLLISSVVVNNQILQPVATTALVTQDSYNYNSSTGVMTFSTAFNGATPIVEIDDSVTVNYNENSNLNLGYYVRLVVKKASLDGLGFYQMTFPRVLLENIEIGADAANDKPKVTCSILPDVTGKYFEEIKI
jgi:hypothetical protein